MRGIDTNVVVRLLLRDDPAQVARVDALMAAGGLFIPATVLIETEWILRAVYRLPRGRINELLRSLAMIEGLHMSDRAGLMWACDRHADGADFADMIHLATTETAEFLTFDRDLVRSAGGEAPSQPVLVA